MRFFKTIKSFRILDFKINIILLKDNRPTSTSLLKVAKKVATRIFCEKDARKTLMWRAFEVLPSMSCCLRFLESYDFNRCQNPWYSRVFSFCL